MATCRMCGDAILGPAASLAGRKGPVPVCEDCRSVALEPLDPTWTAPVQRPGVQRQHVGLALGPLELTGW